MDSETEAKLAKHLEAERFGQIGGALGSGALGGYSTLNQAEAQMPCKSSLRDRIASRARHAARESRHAENLKELQYLLDKNPEVARILELLEAAGERDFV